jgi:hypothetical protein
MTHIFKTKYLASIGLIFLTLIYFISCKPNLPSPIINPSVIKFKVKIRIVDVVNSSTVPAGAVISISGTDADKIFDISIVDPSTKIKKLKYSSEEKNNEAKVKLNITFL